MIFDPVSVSIVIASLVVAFVIRYVRRREPRRARRASGGRPLRRFNSFAHAVARALARRGGVPAHLSYLAVSAGGRRLRIVFADDAVRGLMVRLSVATTREVPPLRVRLEGLVERAWKALGNREDIVVGDGRFDERFFLESERPAEGEELLRGAAMRRSVAAGFARFGAERLTLRPGELSIELPAASLPPPRWREVLQYLERVAVLVETKPLAIRVLEGERAAVCDEAGALRCAYCRDEVTGEEPDLVACDRCRTVVHDACWAEHGGCPVLGCEGEVPERGRARA